MKIRRDGLNRFILLSQGQVYLGLFFVAIFLINMSLGWPVLALTHMRGWRNFVDSYQTLTTADCYQNVGLEVYRSLSGDWCANYLYGGTLLQVLNFLHISADVSYFVGSALLFGLAFTFSYLVRSFLGQGRITFYLAGALILSAPISLLVERGNFDSLIYLLIFGSVLLYRRGYFTLSFCLVALSALFKFYTLPVLPFFLILRRFRAGSIFLYAVAFLTFYIAVRDILRLGNTSVENPNATFGSPILGLLLDRVGIVMSKSLSMCLGWLTIGLAVSLIHLIQNKLPRIRGLFISRSQGLQFDFEDVFSLIFISCFLLGLNYDYRLVFIVPALMATLSRQGELLGKRIFQILIVGIFWLSFDSRFLQPLGDVLLGLLCSYYILNLLYRVPFLIKSRL